MIDLLELMDKFENQAACLEETLPDDMADLVSTMKQSTVNFMHAKGLFGKDFCETCANHGKLECLCIDCDRVASLLVDRLGPTTLATCLAFNCTDGSYKANKQIIRVQFKGEHSTCTWQMMKHVEAFDGMLGLPQTKNPRATLISLGVRLRGSRLQPGSEALRTLKNKGTQAAENLPLSCTVIMSLPISMSESSFEDMADQATNLRALICEVGVDAAKSPNLLSAVGKAALSQMVDKNPAEAKRRASESLVSTCAASCKLSNLWVLLEFFGFGHSKTLGAIFNTALWLASVRALGPGLRSFARSFLLTWLSCDGSVTCDKNRGQICFYIDVHLTAVFKEILEIAAPGVTDGWVYRDQLQDGCRKTVRHVCFCRSEPRVTLAQALLKEADTFLLLAPLGGECGYTPTTPDRLAALREMCPKYVESDFEKKVSLRPLAVTMHIQLSLSKMPHLL
jgi:hypothetical protein